VSFEQPQERWEILDFLLIRAYERLQLLKCPVCGGWLWECSTSIEGTKALSFSVKESRCRKTVELERYENSKLPDKERVKANHHTRRWGLYHKVDVELSSQYAQFYGGKAPSIEDVLESMK
jgi:hypothetical protein